MFPRYKYIRITYDDPLPCRDERDAHLHRGNGDPPVEIHVWQPPRNPNRLLAALEAKAKSDPAIRSFEMDSRDRILASFVALALDMGALGRLSVLYPFYRHGDKLYPEIKNSDPLVHIPEGARFAGHGMLSHAAPCMHIHEDDFVETPEYRAVDVLLDEQLILPPNIYRMIC